MSRNISSLFWAKLQLDGVLLADLIDLTLPNSVQFHWTTANGPITYTLSGASTVYVPFVGMTANGIEENIDLGVGVMDMTIANSGSQISNQLLSQDFALASVKIGQVFTDTPDLGRMELYVGKVGDFSYDRMQITAQARNIWKSLNINWPYYTYQDKCVWRFGSVGCGFDATSVTLAINSINVGSSDTLSILLNSGTLSSSYAAGRFNLGRATITGGLNNGFVRTIRIHTGDLISLSHYLPYSDLSGLTLSIYPGCQKRLLDDCHSTYNNAKNFLGWPWIPNMEQAF